MPEILNTTIEVNSLGTQYVITPAEGYALHSKNRDWEETDEITGETVLHRGYSTHSASCRLDYDFDTTTVIDGYTAHGPKEYFARPISDIDGETNHVFNLPGGNNDHEVMGDKPETETETE